MNDMNHPTSQTIAFVQSTYNTLVAVPYDGRWRLFGWVKVNDPLVATDYASYADARRAARAAGRTVNAVVCNGKLLIDADPTNSRLPRVDGGEYGCC